MQFNFRKNEKLKSEKEIKLLFNEGTSNFIHPLRVIFLFTATDISECNVLISVSKRHFKKAVDRNLLKRRIREAYRLNSHKLKETLVENKQSAKIAFIYSTSKILGYKEIELIVLKHIEYLINKLLKGEEYS